MHNSEERLLWQQFRHQPDAQNREQLFELYQQWAKKEADSVFYQLSIQGAQKEEFRQWAFQGLLEAIERFDPLRNTPFTAFAVHRVRGTIMSALPSLSESSSFYANRGRHMARLEDPTVNAHDLDDGEPVSQLIAMVMNMAVEYLLKESECELTQLTGEFYSSPEINTIAQRIRDHVEALDEPMRSVVKLYYFEDLSFDKVAKLLTLSNARVSQLHKKSIALLKTRAGW